MGEMSPVVCAVSSSFVYIQSQPRRRNYIFVWGYFLEQGKYYDTQPRRSLGSTRCDNDCCYLASHDDFISP